MRPPSLAVAALLAGLTCAAAGAPAVRCDVPSFDFGTSDMASVVEHEFRLANDGDQPLAIEKVNTGCGCTTSNMGTNSVPPGGATSLTVRFSLAGRSGSQRRTIYVHCNDPVRRILQLQLTGVVEPVARRPPDQVRATVDQAGAASVEPRTLDYGVIPREAAVTAAVELVFCVTNAKATAASSDLPGVRVRLEQGGGATQRVNVSTVPPLPVGPMRGRVLIETAATNMPRIVVPVTGTVLGDLRAFPREILVAVGGGTGAVTRTVAIRSREGKSFGIRGTTMGIPGARATWAPVGTNAFHVTLEGILPSLVPATGGVFVVSTDCGGGENVSVPIRAVPP